MNISKYGKTRLNLVAICATLAVGVWAPAHATDLVGPDVTVRYDNSAVDTELGASQLLKRIEGAAARVCARLDHGTLASRTNAQTCTLKLTANAVRKVNHPMLLAVYTSTGRVSPSIASLTK